MLVANLTACESGAPGGVPLSVGLVAPLTGGSAASGEATQRGMLLAMDEVNRAGGVLGRPLELVTRDVHNDPPAGVAALHQLVEQHRIVALFGGIFSPVMVAQLDALHELRIPLINPWGSLTAITRNGRTPNYAFRVSASDEHADEFLARYGFEVVGARRPGILADSTAWGEANAAGLTQWLERLGSGIGGVERFDQDDSDIRSQIERLRGNGADALILVCPSPAGAAIVRGLAVLGWRPPVISHWGISGGQFVRDAGIENAQGVLTLQTYSFHGPLSPRAAAVLQTYHARFGTRTVDDVLAPVGVAHGYDGVHLLARAIQAAGSVDGPQVRAALEHLEPYDGLVKRYAPAFTPERHDALLAEDYLMAVWRGSRLVPAPTARLSR